MEQAGTGAVDRSRALYERTVLGIEDEPTFREVRKAVESRFSESGVRDFLRTLDKAGLRIRDFAAVLAAGKLGSATQAFFVKLSPSDQGQIREFYLASLEKVELPLRNRFFRLYAYY